MGRILGLGGYKESGKDAFAEALPQDEWVVLGMSDPLLEASRVMNPFLRDVGMTVREWEEECSGSYADMKANSSEYRGFLQRMGTEFGRDMIDENVWVNIAKATIENVLAEGKSAAITGIRFPNEIAAIRSLGGELAWVERDGVVAPRDLHSSETSVSPDDFDKTIKNDSTLDDLRAQARNY